MESILFFLAIAIGGIATWQIFSWRYGVNKKKKAEIIKAESNILLERIEKVFKVILAEGYFSEIYDHSSKKDFWGLGLFELNKKALIVAKAKVSIGFDFSKLKWRHAEGTKKIIIDYLPEAEVLSVDPDYTFYDINQGIFQKFNTEDYTKILQEAKGLMLEKALESDLPNSANKQIVLMMNQLAASMNWELDIHKSKTQLQKKGIRDTIKGFLKSKQS